MGFETEGYHPPEPPKKDETTKEQDITTPPLEQVTPTTKQVDWRKNMQLGLSSPEPAPGEHYGTRPPNDQPMPSSISDTPVNQPPKSISDQPSEPKWVDHGIINVPTKELPDPENVNSPSNFDHHIQWEDAEKATKELQDIQAQVATGKTGDDFYKEDAAKGLSYPEGKQRIYDLYYGSDPIVLDKVGDDYTIVSGRHRIFAAKYLEIPSVPARVREKIGG